MGVNAGMMRCIRRSEMNFTLDVCVGTSDTASDRADRPDVTWRELMLATQRRSTRSTRRNGQRLGAFGQAVCQDVSISICPSLTEFRASLASRTCSALSSASVGAQTVYAAVSRLSKRGITRLVLYRWLHNIYPSGSFTAVPVRFEDCFARWSIALRDQSGAFLNDLREVALRTRFGVLEPEDRASLMLGAVRLDVALTRRTEFLALG